MSYIGCCVYRTSNCNPVWSFCRSAYKIQRNSQLHAMDVSDLLIILFAIISNKFRLLIFHCSCSLSFMRYGFVGKMISVYDLDRPPLQCPEEFCYFKAPTKILQWLYMDDDVYWIDLVALFGFFFLIRVLVYFVLLWKLKSKL